jgi:hypothetical protein
LFWARVAQAHWIVKAVMLGLIACSVWVWAIAIDKLFMYARTRRAMDRFEQAFWSGQSIEDLYRTLSAKPTHSMAALFVAAMREWKRSFEGQARSFAGLQMRIEKVLTSRSPARSSGWSAIAGAGHGRLGRPVRRPVRHGLGHHDELPVDRGVEEHLAGGGRARHRRGAVRHRHRPDRRHSGDYFLQQVLIEVNKPGAAHGRLRRRVLGHPVAPDRRAAICRKRRPSRSIRTRSR